MQNLLSLTHGLDYLFFHFLLGTSIFRWAVVSAGGPAAESADPLGEFRWRALLWLASVSSLAWTILTCADMGESWILADLWQAMGHTWFGHLWCVRVLVLFTLAIATRFFQPNSRRMLLASLLLLPLALISSLSGHAASQESGTWWRLSTDLAHSLAAGVWSGGLISLYFWLGMRLQEEGSGESLSQIVVTRFSHLAMASTAFLLASGLLMAWTFGVSPLQPWAGTYRQLILAKTFFFAIALGGAAVNQFVHMRKPESTEANFAAKLRRELRLEIICVALVFLFAGFLTRTSPPAETEIHQTNGE